MIIVVSESAVELREPEDVKRFHIAAPDGIDVGFVLAAASAGGPADGGDAFVSIDWLKEAAAELGVGARWADDLVGMIGYAESKGWLDESGGAIRAHVERS